VEEIHKIFEVLKVSGQELGILSFALNTTTILSQN